VFRTKVFPSNGDDDRISVELNPNLVPAPDSVTDNSLTPMLFEHSPPGVLHSKQSLFETGEMKEFLRYAVLFFYFVVILKMRPY
jgi:hypothetical protein